MGELDGKVAIVTGAGSGIGQGTAWVLARRGASVVVADINGDTAEATAAQARADGGQAVAVTTDVADEAQVALMIATAVSEFGGLDILHNNAALMAADVDAADQVFADLDPVLFGRILQINVIGYALGAKHAIPELRKRGGGAIVNTASGAGLGAEYVRAMYGTSKAAIIALTRSIATQHGEDRIRCNAIAPGIILTPSVAANLSPEVTAALVRHTPIERGGTPEDIGELVAFLGSDRATYITGVVIPVDGGLANHLAHFADQRDAARA